MAGPAVDTEALAAALRDAFPSLGELRIVGVLGSGFNSTAVETDGGYLFRVGRSPEVAVRFVREARVLPALAAALPVAVPAPEHVVERAALLPYGASGYRMIEGRVLAPELLSPDGTRSLGAQTGELLAALHAFPPERARALGVPTFDSDERFRSLRAETAPALRARTTPAEYATIESWWVGFLADARVRAFAPVPTHGDLWFANMLVDATATRLTGVVDWEHLALYDKAQDFCTLLHLGEDFVVVAATAYRAAGGRFEAEDAYRMRRLWQLRHFYGVLYCVRYQDDIEMEDAVRKVREGPVFTEEWAR